MTSITRISKAIGNSQEVPAGLNCLSRPKSVDVWLAWGAQELANPRDLTKIFTTPQYVACRSLRRDPLASFRTDDGGVDMRDFPICSQAADSRST